jgi:serine/threonine-protein kinase
MEEMPREETLLSRYRLVEEIGKGGMAVVYRGEDTTLKREVAVKVLHSFLADKDECRQRFQREARVVAKLRHENILEIFDYSGLDSKDSFIVTEFIHGRTLSEFLQDFEVTVPEIGALIVAEICRAVVHAHESAVIHRDIKPENVMIRRDGVLKLTDFGIAQIIDTQKLTLTGQLLGSPAYMAPEMVLGGQVDFRTDVFSLGVMLYRLATGELPFVGKNPHEVLKKIAESEHLPPSMACPAVSRDLEAIIEKTLALEAADRYGTVAALLTDLEGLLADVGIEDSVSEIRAFFHSPEAYQNELKDRIVVQLLADAREHSRYSRIPAALRCLNRVLSLDEENSEVPELLARLKRRQSLREGLRSASMIILVLVVLAAAAMGVWVWGGRDESSSKRNAPEVKEDSLTLARQTDAADGAVATTAGHAPWSVPRDGQQASGWQSRGASSDDLDGGADPGHSRTSNGDHRVSAVSARGSRRTGHTRRGRNSASRRTGSRSRSRGAAAKNGMAAAAERVFRLNPYPKAVRVSIDGGPARDYGPALQSIKLGPGKHTLHFTSPFCYPKTIVIQPDQAGGNLRPRLAWRKAGLKIISNVSADVQAGPVIGKNAMRLPVPVPKDSPDGSVKVLVKVYASGYHTFQKMKTLKAGTTTTLRVRLRPL